MAEGAYKGQSIFCNEDYNQFYSPPKLSLPLSGLLPSPGYKPQAEKCGQEGRQGEAAECTVSFPDLDCNSWGL